MKKAILLALLSALSATSAAQQANWTKIKDRAASSIVRLHVVHETREQLRPYRQGDLNVRMGSGFFISRDLLVTNQHVVQGAYAIKVEGVATKEKFAMKLAADASVKFDLALLTFVDAAERDRFERINGPIVPLAWADWQEAKPGEQVTVLGFGLSDKLVATQGIISSWEARKDVLERRLDYVTLVRTDAAVNPGNSGGPVLSQQGRVVGISTRFGPGENVGFLIPFATARRVVDTMRTTGRFVPISAGVVTYSVNPVTRQSLGLSPEQVGLVVSRVIPGSPAERAGLRQWDVITAVSDYPVSHGEITHEYAGTVPYWFLFNTVSPGTPIPFDVIREGRQFRVTLAMTPTTRPRLWMPSESDDYKPEWGFLGGMVITEVTRELLKEIEAGGNWRWDLVNDSTTSGKIYIVVGIEPNTQSMSYLEYGLDFNQLRVLRIDGKPLDGDLNRRLDEIYQAVEEGRAPPFVTVDFEKQISIHLNTASLAFDMEALRSRFPALAVRTAGRTHSASASGTTRREGPAHRWLNPTSIPIPGTYSTTGCREERVQTSGPGWVHVEPAGERSHGTSNRC